MMSKLRLLSHENELLGAKLKSVAKLERQVGMVGRFAESMQNAYSRLEGHVTALDAEAEDLSTQVANLQKVRIPPFMLPMTCVLYSAAIILGRPKNCYIFIVQLIFYKLGRQEVYCTLLLFSKLNKIFFGYFYPEKISLDNENK